ncbi:MAG: CTP synthase [Bacteriovoracia bacterium]
MAKGAKQKKYIFVTGGVLSSIGKGIASASMGFLLEHSGIKVTMIKMDPYINVDPGTMSPFQHGEVFVLEDGSECDLDLGHYERFVNCTLTSKNNFTSGKVYDTVIQKERRGEYLGKTVQVIPHITDQIKENIQEASKDADLAIIEIGGTVGDIESLPFLEAIRQLKYDVGEENVLYVHVTLVPYIAAASELKTKPTQHSVKELREIGIQPDILLCRTDRALPKDVKEKIGLFCNLSADSVFSAQDVETIYEVPLNFHREGLDEVIMEKLGMWTANADFTEWERLVQKVKHPANHVKIGIIGKYVDLKESYKSLSEALIHAGVANDSKVELVYIDSEEIQKGKNLNLLEEVHGILVPGGFGERGVEGKIKAIEFARKNKKPFFGICLGLQLAVIEYARNVCGLKAATSEEFSPGDRCAVIAVMEDQKAVTQKGATMRLGAYDCRLQSGTKAYDAYRASVISERHRHRYEVNNEFRNDLEKNGLVISGVFSAPKLELVEIIELSDHPWFLACQFHPEFKSKLKKPHPLFVNFIKASLNTSKV